MKYCRTIFFLLFFLLGIAFNTHAATSKLVIISPHWEGIKQEFTSAFKNWYALKNKGAAVEITWLDQGGTSDDLRFIHSGFSKNPKSINVDLFYGGGIDPYVELAGDGLLLPYKLPDDILKKIPKDINGIPIYDKDYKWYGSSLAGFGILYNKKLLKMYRIKEPATWADLASPDFFGLVGSSDPRHSGSMHMMYEIILQAYGWDQGWRIIKALGANAKSFPKSASQISKDLSVGETAAGLCIDTYAFSAMEETGRNRLGFSFPTRATVINPDPIAILKGAPNPDVAKAFIRFTMSPEGQKIWMFKKGIHGGPTKTSLNKMSVLPELYKNFQSTSNVTINPFILKNTFRYDFKKGSTRWSLLNDLIGAYIIDTHDGLVSGWKRVSKDKKKSDRLLSAPITEKQAANMSDKEWNNPIVKNKIINEWLNSAKKLHSTL